MTDSRPKFRSSQGTNRDHNRKNRPKKTPLSSSQVFGSTTRKPKQKLKNQSSSLPLLRLILVWGVICLSMLGLAGKLYQLQIIQASKLQKKARQQQTTSLRPYIPRRSIIDSQENILATDRLEYTLYVHPKLFKISLENMAAKLAPILETKTPQQLIENFKKQKTGIRLADGLNESAAAKIKKLSLDGLELNENYNRFYPQEAMVADVIGYVDKAHQGQAGIEHSQRNILERDLLNAYIRRTGNGTVLPAFLPQNLLKSNDWELELTLDLRLQRAARAALQRQLKKFQAKRGTVIVMDAHDGSILALTCEPTFNPNEYYKSKVELFKNWTVADLYEPGSTFKPINIAIALDAKAIEPNTIVHDSGIAQIGPWKIYNSSKQGYGTINIAEVLQTSSNIGMIQIMQRLTKQDYYRRLQQLGLGNKSGIDLPGEAEGHVKSEAEFTSQAIEAATTAFGQGFSLTPIKLIQLHGALANGGKLVTPHIVKGLVDADGYLHWKPELPTKPVFSPKTSQEVVNMMETVVSKGTGKAARIPQYRIAGKTGTAQKASPTGGYLPNAKITSFVGILPADAPRYVVLAVIDEPQGGNTFGSTVAAPIVKSVMEALIAIKGIPPSQSLPQSTVDKSKQHSRD